MNGTGSTDTDGNIVSYAWQFGDPAGSTATGATASHTYTSAGTYTVREVQPAGYFQGTNTLGNLGGRIQGDTMTLTLPACSRAIRYNFGEVLTPTRPPDNQTDDNPSKFLLIEGGLRNFNW